MENELDPKRFKLRCLEKLQRKKLLQSECFDSILVLFLHLKGELFVEIS